MGTRQTGVRPATDGSIEIDFRYKRQRCRERIKLPPTARNLAYAANVRGRILLEIAKGTFDYAKEFPDSPRAALLAQRPGGLRKVSDALDAWYKRKAAELEHSTLIGYRRIIDNVLTPAIGKTALRDLTRSDIKGVVEGLGAEVSLKRINNVLGPLRGMLTDEFDDEAITSNPAEKLKFKRRPKVKLEDDIDPFSPAEIEAILAACCDVQFRNFCQFNFATGLRTSEMIGLEWPRVDQVQNRARIVQAFVMGAMKTAKTDAGLRDVDLLPQALAALRLQRTHTLLANGAVFNNPMTDRAWDTDKQIREWFWRPALKRAGVRYRYPYQMRHTFASQALSAGENIMWVARQLGHKDWTVTAKCYARWIPSVVPDAGAKVSALWTGTEG